MKNPTNCFKINLTLMGKALLFTVGVLVVLAGLAPVALYNELSKLNDVYTSVELGTSISMYNGLYGFIVIFAMTTAAFMAIQAKREILKPCEACATTA